VLLLALALVRGLIYAAVIPPWQAPDETGHFEYAWLIAHQEGLSNAPDLSPTLERTLLSSLYEWRYGDYIGRALPQTMPDRMNDLSRSIFARRSRTVLSQRFSLAYLWQAAFLWPFQHQDLAFQLYAARLSSIVLNVLVIYLSWRIFGEVIPKPEVVAAMTAFIVFLPQHTFINASVNEGPLAELAACVVLLGWVRLFRRQTRSTDISNIAAIAGGTLIGLWTKRTAAFLLPFDLLALILLLNARLHTGTRERRLGYLVVTLGVIGLLGTAAFQTPAGDYIQTWLRRWWSDPTIYVANDQTTLGHTLWQTFDSFWAQFGWMNVRAGPFWYLLIYILTVVALEGWIWPRSSSWDALLYAQKLLGGALALVVASWLAFVLFTPNGLAFSQGRYWFPAAVPAAFFLMGGWIRWLPERHQPYAGLGMMITLATLDAAAMSLTIWPFFYAS
jgi:hypothetical protein